MNLFITLIITIFFLSSILGVFLLYKKVYFDHFYFMSIKSLLKKFANNQYFCSRTVFQIIKILPKKKLLNLALGRIDAVFRFLENQQLQDLAISLLGFKNPQKSLEEFEKIIKEQPKNMFILGEMAELYLYEENFEKLYLIINLFDEKLADNYTKAKFLYLEAIYDLRFGNMMSVCEKLERASKLFSRQKAFVEEARCYCLMGTAYKISGIFDVAQFVFATSLEIYQRLNFALGIYEIYGNLGSLMSIQKRFEEANGYFEKALELDIPSSNKAYILNQKALNHLLEQKYDKAQEFISLVLESDDLKAKAFALEIMSYIKYETKDFSSSIEFAKKSEEIYEKINNISAFLETKYARAITHFEMDDINESENLAREILEAYKLEQNSFHIANCYNLLGLILLKKGEYNHAKGLFLESINLEQKNERIKEVATDYINVSIAEIKMGKKTKSKKTLEIALIYALQAGEDELVEIIEERLRYSVFH